MKSNPGTLFVVALAASATTATSDLGGSGTSTGGSQRTPSTPRSTWLGVSIVEAPPEIAGKLPIESGTGLVVDHVIPDSPAAIAGIQRNDVLARLNDQTLVTFRQLKTLVMNRKPGEQVEVTYFRKGEKRRVVVMLMLIDQ